MRTRTTWSDLMRPGDAASFFDRDPLPPFQLDAEGFNLANAWWLAEISRLVYRHENEGDRREPTPSRTEFLRKAGLTQIRFFDSEKTGTQGFLVRSEHPAFAILAFRGTEQSLRDFTTDGAFLRVPLDAAGKASVHEGFKRAIESVWPRIAEDLDQLRVPVFYTGHSLGGALVTLAVARKAPRAAYTFGCPLVGDAAFAESLHGLPLYRVVNGADMMTLMPPEELGFVHAGELHAIGPRLNLLSSPSLKDLKERLVTAFLSFPDPLPILADHAPINYVERIAAEA
ncbi:MAG TPA: lipase family protein [Thermoanaerobaculia bacterium]|nr:lipase family protein [Thermoanaerobaculia bacterium]